MPRKSPIKFIATHFVWFLCVVALLLGVVFLLWSLQLPGPAFQGTAKDAIGQGGIIVGGVNAAPLSEHSVWREIIRDVGIALLVAAIVTAIFELHVRSRSDLETITGVLSVAMGDIIRPEIWKEVRSQVIERRMIRQNVEIHIRELRMVGTLFGPAIMTLEFEYDLLGLRSKKEEDLKLMHYLDAHIEAKDLPEYEALAGLPKFEYIKVGDTEILSESPLAASPNEYVKDGMLTYLVDLEPRDGKAIHVSTKRKEIIYIPGSYNLVMGEITKGVVLHLDDLPESIEASVNLRPHTEKDGAPLLLDRPLRDFKDTIMLPGQGIEFKFKRVVRPAASTPPPPNAAEAAAATTQSAMPEPVGGNGKQ